MIKTKILKYGVVFILQLCILMPAQAIIIIDGDPDFEAEVLACFEIIQGVGGRPARVLDELKRSANDHTIQENEGLGRTRYDNPAAANVGGAGSGSTIDWDPDFPWVYRDGVKRDFCAALYHEMSHAHAGDTGSRVPGNDAASGIRNSEVAANGATTMENEFRNARGLEQRAMYGANPLPASAMVP